MDRLCPICQKPLRSGNYHPKCYQKHYHENRRNSIIKHYGGKCENCGTTGYDMSPLTLAYKNPDSVKITGGKLYTWIIQNNYPNEFVVLCQLCLYDKMKEDNEPKRLATRIRQRMNYKAKKRVKRDALDLENAYRRS